MIVCIPIFHHEFTWWTVYDPAIHDQKYDLKDDWIPQVPSTIINTKTATKRGKNVFGNRGITSIGSCTLTKVNSAQNRKIIDHILNQCPFREKIKEKYPLQISRLEQSVIDSPPPRMKRSVELCSSCI